MKLEPVTKLTRETKTVIDDDVMLANGDAIVIFLNYGQFGKIQTPDSGHMICKTYIL